MIPDLGFAAVEAAGQPVAADDDIDVVALVLGDGLELGGVAVGEGLEFSGIFAIDDGGVGVDAGFEVIHGGAGLAFGGAGPGGFLRIGAVGFGLFVGGHGSFLW